MVVNRSSAHALIGSNSSMLICMHLGVDSKIKFAKEKKKKKKLVKGVHQSNEKCAYSKVTNTVG